MPREAVVQRVRELPDSPGIYIFRDAAGEPLYVGKAKSLRKRVASYLKPDLEARLRAMVGEAEALEWIVTSSEAEALLLENNWIKDGQPRFNIRLRDDKTYPYLKLTLADDYPRLAFTRRILPDGAAYFGPFLPAGVARRAIKVVQKLFQIRVCRIEIDGKLPRPCLYFDMHRCLAPCVDGLTDAQTYQGAVEQATLFLSGRSRVLVVGLRKEMREASDRLDFERAAQLRDLIREIQQIGPTSTLSSHRGDDADIYGAQVAGDRAAVTVLVMRGGQVLDRREHFWENEPDLTVRRLLSELLPQFYERTTFIPREILLPVAIDGSGALADWLSERRGSKVRVNVPQRGSKVERVALAERNAAQAYRRRFRLGAGALAGSESLRTTLALTDSPRRIEGFDISTLHGGETVASLVVWKDGAMAKREYRSFNIRGLDRADDFESLRQAVGRAYARRLKESGELPDLIMIDGGRGQLNAALGALTELGIEELPIVGLAKRDEEIYVPENPEPLRLPRRDYGLRLLQQVRDEAHRFALSRHRRRRSKRTLQSRFDDLPGIGPTRRRRLVARFGSFAGVERASRQELQEVLGTRIGSRLWENLHPDETGSPTR